LGDFLGNFSLSLGDFFTKTSGHPASSQLWLYLGACTIKLITVVIYGFS
jgi:hypothetical protein